MDHKRWLMPVSHEPLASGECYFVHQKVSGAWPRVTMEFLLPLCSLAVLQVRGCSVRVRLLILKLQQLVSELRSSRPSY